MKTLLSLPCKRRTGTGLIEYTCLLAFVWSGRCCDVHQRRVVVWVVLDSGNRLTDVRQRPPPARTTKGALCPTPSPAQIQNASENSLLVFLSLQFHNLHPLNNRRWRAQ